MAVTLEGRRLTEQHRRAQLQIRARALSDYQRLWPIWQESNDQDTYELLVTATLALIRSYNQLSATAAGAYFTVFRQAEGIAGTATPRIAVPPPPEEIQGNLYVTGRQAYDLGVKSGKSPAAARQNALVRTSGTVTRLTLAGGRTTIVDSSLADQRALGYARVTAGDPCAFCVMLASRGPVYKEDTVDFEAHDHCSCTGEPFYRGADWPGRGEEFRDLYDRVAAGTDNPVNELRRALEEQRSA